MTTFTQNFYKELQELKDQGYFDDAEEQQPLNLSLLQTIMGLGVREKVISSCPHKPCHEEIKDGRSERYISERKNLDINELRDNQVVEGVEDWFMKECYTDEEDGGHLISINEADFITNQIYLSKVFLWHVKNGLSFDELCEDIENIIHSLWEEEEERADELNLPDIGACTFYIIWQKVYDWLIYEHRGVWNMMQIWPTGWKPTLSEKIAISFMGTEKL